MINLTNDIILQKPVFKDAIKPFKMGEWVDVMSNEGYPQQV